MVIKINVSVILCNYNGEKYLQKCIESLLFQKTELNYEVLLIDNNSTDSSKKIMKLFLKKRVNVKYILEKKQGLSFSRNRGIKESKGEIIAFIDNDAFADKYWIQNIYKAFSSKNIVCVGGKVLPIFEKRKPFWLSNDLTFLSVYDLGNTSKSLKRGESIPLGVNMAFKKSIFSKLGMFRTDLGRIKNSLLSGEEMEFCSRIYDANYQIAYEPNALVHHIIQKERLTLNFFIKRYYWEGISREIISQNRLPTTYMKNVNKYELKTILKGIIFGRAKILFYFFFIFGRWKQKITNLMQSYRS